MATEASIYQTLTEIFHDVFVREDIQLRPDLKAADVEGWDSFKQIEIIVAAEQRFGIRLNSREMDSLTCVGDLARVIEQKLPEG
jgi:acyl carrier protein